MDPDALQDEVDEWVRDGIITDDQAEEILSRYDPDEDRRPRAVLVLSLVGSALVFAGVVLFLATNWQDLHRAARTLVLLAGPALAYYGGSTAYEYDVPRVSHALYVLGAVLVGPSLFLFDDMFAFGIAPEWLLMAWAGVALSTGHVLRSRPATGLGITLLAFVVVALSEPANPFPAVGLLGVGVFALGRMRAGGVPWTYRMGGVTMALGTLLLMTMLEGEFAAYDVGPTPVLAGTVLCAIAGVWSLHQAGEREAVEWSAIVLSALTLSTTVALFAPETVSALLAFVSLHVAGLAGLVATGYLGYRTRSRTVIDLVAVGGLVQTLSFVEATVVSALSGAIALVVAGLLLLAAGVAVERGRRTVLSHIR